MSTTKKARQSADTFILIALVAVAAMWSALHIHWAWTPMEDAAMLLRYAQHLAAGEGVRWSVNQAPVDGATDFLFMALIAAVSRLAHMDVVTASRWLNLAAQLGSVVLVYRGARRLHANCWVAIAAALYLIAGPFIGLTNACFGAPVFAFFLAACWSFGLRYALDAASWRNALGMAGCGLLAGLTRPEGVLIALLLLVAVLFLKTGVSKKLIFSHGFFFGVLGSAYFAWRWRYFGYPLPNPFYIKGDGHLYFRSVRIAAMNVATLLLPWLPVIPLGWASPQTRRLTQALLVVLVPFTLMWVLLTNANNHLDRFQYAIVPLALMTLPALLPAGWLADLAATPRKVAAALAMFAAVLYVSRITAYSETAWGMRTFAQRLAVFAPHGYTMAVTEAGALPLYAEWNAIDIIGLNDSYIAHHGQRIDEAYLDRAHPELIMTHIDRSVPEQYRPGGLAQAPHAGAQYNTEFANRYAIMRGYTLAAAWGADQCNLHLYWLRQPSAAKPFADYAPVLSDIRDHGYNFLDSGFLAHDYRDQMASIEPCAAPEGPAAVR